MSYDLRPLGPERFLVWDLLRETDPYYLNHHLFDIDMTAIEEDIQRRLAAGEPLISYLAYVLSAYACMLAEFPVLNSYLRIWPLTRLAVYRGVDIAFPIERIWEGNSIVLLGLLKDAQNLKVDEINSFLSERRDAPLDSLPEFGSYKRLLKIPSWCRWWLFQLGAKPFPGLMRRLVGTTAVTSVGKFGTTLTTPLSPHSCTVSLGLVETRPRVVEGRVEPRLSAWITVTYDHRVADGAFVARFGAGLRRRLESLNLALLGFTR